MEALEIRKRFNVLVTERSALDSVLQIIEMFVVPFRGNYFMPGAKEAEVDWRKRNIFDSTAVIDCQTLASSIQGGLTNSLVKWFSLQFRQKSLNKDNDAMEWLQECEDIVWKTLQDSNFKLEASEFYIDLVSGGTGAIIEETNDETEEWEGVDFAAAPIADIYFEEDKKGNPKILYRRLMWHPLQIIDKFGKDKCPEWVIKEHEKASGNKIELILCMYYRESNKKADTSKYLAPHLRPFGTRYVFQKDGSTIGVEGGKYEMPAFIARFRKVAGSRWGHSSAHICLSDILTLNQLTEETLDALGKVVDPSTIVTLRGLLSDLDLGRGGLTVVRSKDDIWPHESKARFDVGELKIDRLQQAIHRAFFVDQLELKDSPAMTATESSIRYELMQRLLGPTVGRLENDWLNPCITRTFNINMRAGRLPPPPAVVVESKAEYDIIYTGPLARAQRMQIADSINQFVANIAGLADVFPEALDVPNIDDMVREVAMLSGIPARLINGEAQVTKKRKDRQEQQQKVFDAQQALAEGDAVQSVAAGVKAIGEV